MIETIRDHLFKRHFYKLGIPLAGDQVSSVNRLSSITLLAQSPYYTAGEIQKAIDFFSTHDIICQAYLVDVETTEPVTTDTDVDIITRREFRWIGIPRKDLLIKWLSYKADLLIALNPGHSPLLRYLCAASSCQLKSAIDYGHTPDKSIDFYLQLDRANTRSVKELSMAIYEALKNIS